jgi:hypothetical protein
VVHRADKRLSPVALAFKDFVLGTNPHPAPPEPV